MTLPLDFASLLCSRLCHDLVSPVGALTNGVELLADETDPKMREQCMELLADTARQTAAKLKFFRLAFGAAGGYGEQIDLGEVKAAIDGLFQGSRVEVAWAIPMASLSKTAVKALLNLAMMVGDGLLRGGTLTIAAQTDADGLELVVRADGPRTLLTEDLRRTLLGQIDPASLDPRAAPAYLVRQLVTQASGTLALSEVGEPHIAVGVRLPG
jgi:histidine phosphotransferase ChpT